MNSKIKFKDIGVLGLYESDSYLFRREELEDIFRDQNVIGADIAVKIANHEHISFEPSENRAIKFNFWVVSGTDDEWIMSITKPRNSELVIIPRLKEILEKKEPIESKVNDGMSMKTKNPTVWLTYSWKDNQTQDVDFIAQELESYGVHVKLDRWNIGAGKRLWEQIEHFIQDKNECDAWVFYATTNSLGSEPCKEEYAYALDRALNSRGADFPIIGLFPSSVDNGLIPAGVRTRLYVSTNDTDWKERVKAAAEGRNVNITREIIQPYYIKKHAAFGGKIIEVRPRAGEWYPFIAGFPISEKDKIGKVFEVIPGPPNTPPDPRGGFILQYDGEGKAIFEEIELWIKRPRESASPSKSMYIVMLEYPERVAFGIGNTTNCWLISTDTIK
jgi:hypothetical protein